MTHVRRTRIHASIDEERGVFMISVAAELAEMHPQTLRMYEARGLITPKRSPKNTRLYSQRDVERLRRIQQMTGEDGLNLAGVETVLEMEEQVTAMRSELAKMREKTTELERQMAAVERARDTLKAEIVPYGAYEAGIGRAPGAEAPELAQTEADDDADAAQSVRIPIKRTRSRRSDN